jgi:hypothetical protein
MFHSSYGTRTCEDTRRREVLSYELLFWSLWFGDRLPHTIIVYISHIPIYCIPIYVVYRINVFISFHILYIMSGLGKLEEINRQVNLEFEFYRFRHAFVDGFTKSKLLHFNYLFNSPLTLFILVILYFWLRKLF